MRRVGVRGLQGNLSGPGEGGEFVAEVRGDEDAEVDVGPGVVVFLEDLAEGVEAGEGALLGEGDGEFEFGADGTEAGGQFLEQFRESLAGACGDGDGACEEAGPTLEDVLGRKEVDLVEDHQGGAFGSADLGEHAIDGTDLFLGVRVADVDDVEEEVGFDDFLEGGLERLDEAVRELPDEPDGVAEEDVLVGGQPEAPGGGIERGEEFVLGEDAGAREAVEEGGLSGVRVADDGREGPLVALASVALGLPLATHDIEFVADAVDAFLGLAAVGFELGFAFAADGSEPTALTGKVGPEAGEAWEEVLELGELDLELAFAGAGALGEDLEDQGGPVEDLAAERFLQIPGLRTGEFVVEDHGVDAEFLAARGELRGLAGSDAAGRMGCVELLGAIAEDDSADGGGELAEFVERIADVPGGAGLEFEADEEGSFRAAISGFDEGFQSVRWRETTRCGAWGKGGT
jgi:hypothetical protein